jgi:hypothetical protein
MSISTYTPGSLASGQVASSVGAIYTATSPIIAAFIQRVTFFNNSATPQTIILYIHQAGNTRRAVRQWVLAQYESAAWPDEGVACDLSTGDTLDAITTTASQVDYTVTGVTGT